MYITEKGKSISIGKQLGKGGEGCIYALNSNQNQVAKVYHRTHCTPDRERKLEAMITSPPNDNTRQLTLPHVSIAWPTDIIYENKHFVGFLMPLITKSPNIFEIYNTNLRKKNYPFFNLRYLHRTAKNLVTAINALHALNYIIVGDINQRNVLVTQEALVTVVDTDSFQVKDSGGYLYYCTVGVPEYTAPELHGKSLGSIERTKFHDRFGMAVLVFQLLMEGFHPFTGVPQNLATSINELIYVHCIKHGFFPYTKNNSFNPPPNAPAFNRLHPVVQNSFLKCFVNGYKDPSKRPDACEWISVLDTAEQALVNCGQNSQHIYSNHLSDCPYCKHNKRQPVSQQPIISHNKGNRGTELIKLLIYEQGIFWSIDPAIINRNLNWNDTNMFMKSLNDKKYLGYSNWRLPFEDELKKMVLRNISCKTFMQYGNSAGPGIKSEYLQQHFGGLYWTSNNKATFGQFLVHMWSGHSEYVKTDSVGTDSDVALVWPVCPDDGYGERNISKFNPYIY